MKKLRAKKSEFKKGKNENRRNENMKKLIAKRMLVVIIFRYFLKELRKEKTDKRMQLWVIFKTSNQRNIEQVSLDKSNKKNKKLTFSTSSSVKFSITVFENV